MHYKWVLNELKQRTENYWLKKMPEMIQNEIARIINVDLDISDLDDLEELYSGITGARYRDDMGAPRIEVYIKYTNDYGHDEIDYFVLIPCELQALAKAFNYRPDYLKLEVDNGLKEKTKDYWDRKRDNPTRNGLRLIA